MTTEQFEQFKATLRLLVTELENIWIEAEAYRTLILATAIATPETLQQVAQKALDDPNIRNGARQQFSQMWNALDQTADGLLIAELLGRLPPSGKPN